MGYLSGFVFAFGDKTTVVGIFSVVTAVPNCAKLLTLLLPHFAKNLEICINIVQKHNFPLCVLKI